MGLDFGPLKEGLLSEPSYVPPKLLLNMIIKFIGRANAFTSETTTTTSFDPLTFLFLRAFRQWQVVTGTKAEKIIESLPNYIWFS